MTVRILGCLACICAIGCLTLASRKGEDKPVPIFSGPVGELGPICSPDGRWLAFEYFTSKGVSDTEIWIMPTHGTSREAKPVLNDKRYEYGEIAWSPDSAWISFIGNRSTDSIVLSMQIYKVNIFTRQIVQLTSFPDATGLGAGTSWSRDGHIAFEMNDDMYVVPESGGSADKLLDVRKNLPSVAPYFPTWSPDGSRLAFVGRRPGKNGTEHTLYVLEVQTGRVSSVFQGVGDDGPSWLDVDHVLCSHEDGEDKYSLWLIPVSPGSPLQITRGHYDGTPSTDPAHTYLFFSRSDGRSKPSLSSPARGFHLWKLCLNLVRVADP